MFEKASLSPTGWHAHLQRWTFGHIPYKNNFCPYFWITIFSLLVLPFVVSWKIGVRGSIRVAIRVFGGFCWVLEKIIDPPLDALDRWLCKPWYKRQMQHRVECMSDEDAYDLAYIIFSVPFPRLGTGGKIRKTVKFQDTEGYSHLFYDFSKKKRDRYLEQWEKWKARQDNWKKKLVVIRKKQIKQEEILAKLLEKQKAARKAAELRSKKFFAALVKYTKYLLLLPIGIVAIYLTKWLVQLSMYIYTSWGGIAAWLTELASAIWLFVATVTPYIFAGIAIVAVAVGLILVIVALAKKCNISFSMPGSRLLKGAGSKVVLGLDGIFEFFSMYIKAIKENHCPSIEWKDED